VTERLPLKARIRATYGPDAEDPRPEATTRRADGIFDSGGTVQVFIDEGIRLDLGAGPIVRPGHIPLGRGYGSEIFPLPYADETVSEIAASHVLEHFPHGQVAAVVKDWARTLKRGGRLRIAVPDFRKIARDYLQAPYCRNNLERCLMGGQIDANDFHKAIFDEPHLSALMHFAGLTVTGSWDSEIADCARDPISLNLEGRKL